MEKNLKSLSLKNLKKWFAILPLCMIAVLSFSLAGCGSDWYGDTLGGGQEMTGSTPEESTDNYSDEIDESISTIEDDDTQTSVPDGAETITGSTKISSNGNYVISGTIDLGSEDSIKVQTDCVIYLNGVTITSSNADDEIFKFTNKDTVTNVTLVVVDGTTNTLTSSAAGAILLNKNATLNIVGSGTLNITSSGAAIKSKGDLFIQDATITATSLADNVIKANGTLTASRATISATAYEDYGCALKASSIVLSSCSVSATTADKDAIHAEIDEYDELTEAPNFASASEFYSQGYIYCTNSTLNLTTTGEGDGMQADTFIKISGGSVSIKTNGGAPSSVTENSSDNAAGKGIKVGLIDYILVDESGNVLSENDLDSEYYAIYIEDSDESECTISINSNDDAIHSNAEAYIIGGNITISTGDDGIHADNLLKISGSNTSISINKSYEGIEAAKIEISGGNISVTATDDGVNAADGTQTAVNSSNDNCYLIVSGGTLSINAQGDGLDSNGSMLISGGSVFVNGPASGSADAALDSDGGILVTGGEIFAVGSKQMVETPSTNSTQCVISYSASSTISAGTTLTLKDSSGNSVISITTARTCQSLIISSAALEVGSTYTLYSGSTKLSSFTLSQIITSISSSGNNQGFGGSGGFGGNGGTMR